MSKFLEEIIGDCTLYLGDCLDVLPTLSPVDAVVTDPPYGIRLSNNGQFSALSRPVHLDDDPKEVQNRIDVLIKLQCNAAFFCSPFNVFNGPWNSVLVWDKGGGVGAGGDPARCWKRSFELILVRAVREVFPDKGRDVAVIRRPIFAGIVANENELINHDHACAKPVDLMEYLIRRLSRTGEQVFDPFMGSGTTGVACVRLGRKFIGIEIEPRYFDIACRRIEEETKRPRLPLDEPAAQPVQEAMF